MDGHDRPAAVRWSCSMKDLTGRKAAPRRVYHGETRFVLFLRTARKVMYDRVGHLVLPSDVVTALEHTTAASTLLIAAESIWCSLGIEATTRATIVARYTTKGWSNGYSPNRSRVRLPTRRRHAARHRRGEREPR